MKKHVFLGIYALLFIYSFAIAQSQSQCSNTFQTDKKLVEIDGIYYKAIYFHTPSPEGENLTDLKVAWQKITITDEAAADLKEYRRNFGDSAKFMNMIYNPIIKSSQFSYMNRKLHRNYEKDFYIWRWSNTNIYHTISLQNNALVSASFEKTEFDTPSDGRALWTNLVWFIGIAFILAIISSSLPGMMATSTVVILRKCKKKNPYSHPFVKALNSKKYNLLIGSIPIMIGLIITYYSLWPFKPVLTTMILLIACNVIYYVWKIVAAIEWVIRKISQKPNAAA